MAELLVELSDSHNKLKPPIPDLLPCYTPPRCLCG
jgi:hypothetical protein